MGHNADSHLARLPMKYLLPCWLLVFKSMKWPPGALLSGTNPTGRRSSPWFSRLLFPIFPVIIIFLKGAAAQGTAQKTKRVLQPLHHSFRTLPDSLFQSEFSTDCDLLLSLSICSICSLGHPVAAYVFFLVFPSLLSSLPFFLLLFVGYSSPPWVSGTLLHFRCFRRIAQSDYYICHVCTFVCQSARNSALPTGRIFVELDNWEFFENLSGKIQD